MFLLFLLISHHPPLADMQVHDITHTEAAVEETADLLKEAVWTPIKGQL